jgi:regulator of RNase E activity RraA
MAHEFDIDPALRELLSGIGTATLSSQLIKRGLRNTFIPHVAAVNPAHARMIGPAYTLSFIPSREDLAIAANLALPTNPQRAAIEQVPPGHVLIMDARGEPGSGNLGDILIARLSYRGVSGVVTDGAMRDAEELRKIGFPVFCSGFAAPPSYCTIMATDANRPIGCGGVAVYPGDIIVGDQDGVVVIPPKFAAEVARDAAEQERMDRFVRKRVDRGASTAGLYPPNEANKAAYQRWVAAGETDSAL